MMRRLVIQQNLKEGKVLNVHELKHEAGVMKGIYNDIKKKGKEGLK